MGPILGELLCQLDELLTLKLPVNLYCKGFCHTLGSWLELCWTKTGQNKKTLGVPQPWNWWFSKIRWLIVWLNNTIQRCYPDDCHQVYPRTESFMGPSTLSLLTRLLISNTLCISGVRARQRFRSVSSSLSFLSVFALSFWFCDVSDVDK